MVILESFSMGIPVVASRLGTMGELIQDGVNGQLFEPGNANSLRSVVERLQVDSIARQNMSAGARRSWETHYAPETNFVLLRGIYERVAGS